MSKSPATRKHTQRPPGVQHGGYNQTVVHVVHHAGSCGERIECPFATPNCERFSPYRPGEAIATRHGDVFYCCHGCGLTKTVMRERVP